MKIKLISIFVFVVLSSSSLNASAPKNRDETFQKIYKKAIKKNFNNGDFQKSNKDKLRYSIGLKNGNLAGNAVCFYRNGQLKEKAYYKNSLLHGEYSKYHEDGSFDSVFNYLAGRLHGPARIYNKSGILISEGNFTNGVLNGPYKNYYDNGSLRKICSYKNNLDFGPVKTFYPNGQRQVEGNFLDGALHGQIKTYKDDGRLIEVREYKHGQPIYTAQELEFMKIQAIDRAARKIAFQQALNNVAQFDQNNLIRQQNQIMMMNATRPSFYSGTITNTGFGNYRVNMTGF